MSRRKKNVSDSTLNTNNEFKARSIGQADYLRAIIENTVTFCIGPAGTGKSYIGLGLAAQYLNEGKVNKIIIARPTIEAAPKGIGFLKGNLDEKMAPWVLPAVEHLKRFLGKEAYGYYYNHEQIEFAPLEYMRGRTFLDAFIILEEAQNCTTEQLKMFVTRIGCNCKMVINGDINQTDIKRQNSEFSTDLEYVISKIEKNNLSDFAVHELFEQDIQRSPIIGPFLRIFK